MLTLNDGRSELWQWDTGRTLTVDAECSQVHFSNKVFGRSIDVDVVDGVAIIPDILLQTDKDLFAWAFVGTAENGYTKISKIFKVNRRNKPADYVFTPSDQTTLAELVERLDKIEETQDPDAIKNAVEDYLEQNPIEAPVQSVNGQTGTVELTAEDVGAISKDDLQGATNEVLAQAKASGEFKGEPGQPGQPGKDGKDYVLTDADKSEIAEMAAELVDVPEGSGGGGTLLPETEISQEKLVYGFDINTVPVGEKVAVIMDGKPYITTHREEGEGADAIDWIGNIAMLAPAVAGTEHDTGEPFFAQLFGSHSTFFFADGASHKIAIYTVDALDEAYIRALNSIGNMSGGSGSFVVNVTADGTLTPTNADKTYEEIYGAIVSGMSVVAMVDGGTAVPYAGVDLDNDRILFAFNGGTYGGAEIILFLSVTPENVWSITQKDFITAEDIGMKYVSSNTFNTFTKGVAKVQTATVGQTIKVKSVDDNGVPTAWETADLPQGGGGETAAEAQLATGTIEEGTAAGYIDTGVTLAALKKYKRFTVTFKGATNTGASNVYLTFSNKAQYALYSIARSSGGGWLYGFEWLNIENSLLRAFVGWSGNPSLMPNLGTPFVRDGVWNGWGTATDGNTGLIVYKLSGCDEANTLRIYLSEATKTSYAWEVRGLTV